MKYRYVISPQHLFVIEKSVSLSDITKVQHSLRELIKVQNEDTPLFIYIKDKIIADIQTEFGPFYIEEFINA